LEDNQSCKFFNRAGEFLLGDPAHKSGITV
jgi:hypothetical protein